MIPERYAWHGDVEVLYNRSGSGRWCGWCRKPFFAILHGAEAIGAVFVEERGAFVVELAAGEQESEVGGKGNVSVYFVPEFAGESEECGWHG